MIPPSFSRRKQTTIVAFVSVVLLSVIVTVVVLYHRHRPPTDPRSVHYEQVVSAFYSGIIALDVNDNPRAKDRLTAVTQLAPTEPAGWANLGLYYLREGNFPLAATHLDRARQLAPDNAQIEVLSGLLEDRRGDFGKAIQHLQRAIELNPKGVRARYSIAAMYERNGDEQSAASVVRQYDALLALLPNNLEIIVDAARAHAKLDDARGLRDVLSRLPEDISPWPAVAKTQLAAVRKSAAADKVRPTATMLIFLRNALLRWPPFQHDLSQVATSDINVGEPIDHFIKLPTPSSDPAAPDIQLSMSLSLLPIGGAGFTCSTTAWLGSDGPPIAYFANGHEVRGENGTPAIPFPGGPDFRDPGPDGMLAVDWRNSYATGLVLAGAGGVKLIDKATKDITAAAIDDAAVRDDDYTGAWAADLDLDGDLDLVLAKRNGPPVVLRNNGDGTFKSVRLFPSISNLRQFAWIDMDGSGVPSAALLDSKGNLSIMVNDRNMQFHLLAAPAIAKNILSIAVADVARRGRADLLALLSDGSVLRIFQANASSTDLSSSIILPSDTNAKVSRLIVADVDNNGATDLILSGRDSTKIFLGDGTGKFIPAQQIIPANILQSSVDARQPGGIALLGVDQHGLPVQAQLIGKKGYHFQIIRPRALASTLTELHNGQNKINTFAIGGEIELRSALLYQSQTIEGGATHFGIGTNVRTDVARILWPNGNVQAEFDLKADQASTADQRLKGSCPMLFAYDGNGMQFVTDLIWRSPLGLRINAQDTATVMQTEDWVKIGRTQLIPRPEGYYDLRVTAELWETHFFDQISLMTVDHPRGTEIFVDERFAVPPPALKVYVTTPVKPFSNATDEHGNDVSDLVREQDGRYLDSFQRGEYQGIAEDHWVELELSQDVSLDQPIALIASGWIHPTDSSINFAIAQGKHAVPNGLTIETCSTAGAWTVAREGIGFPAGKNKTIVLPLNDLFRSSGRRRFRLRTNMEIYWDRLGWAQLLDKPVQTQRLPAAYANLGYRGFSLISAADVHSPELPRYDLLTGTAPRWRDLIGYYTRYGDVRALLETTDDRYVIMNAGDEIRLRFNVPAAPGTNDIRDFVLISDGWVKDGDYNTAFSKTVSPLPRHDWPKYDSQPQELENDPAFMRHPEDWLNYHTRYITSEPFRQVLHPELRRE